MDKDLITVFSIAYTSLENKKNLIFPLMYYIYYACELFLNDE